MDSNPVTEAEETRNKAEGVLASIELAEQVVLKWSLFSITMIVLLIILSAIAV